ncbi:MAG TPA: 5-formyltetrahydrofolate cyclo-ligase [Buchnera sp. (in: enterobacteria)]|nr:5-formyltetrahydrofolate cyclo-ligase [Buchnera sp. (in: enterobacteria)]
MLKNTLIRNNIRLCMRRLRNTLTHYEQKKAALEISEKIFKYDFINKVNNVGLFLSFDGEIDTQPLILKLWNKNINIYMPVLDLLDTKNLLFMQYTATTQLKLNKLNIFEPINIIENSISIDQLDVIFIPLVAFNKKGYRLGMGGGFYDRILKNWKENHFLPIGLAHNFQFISFFPIFSWDIPLPFIVTPKKIWNSHF